MYLLLEESVIKLVINENILYFNIGKCSIKCITYWHIYAQVGTLG